MVDAHIKVLLVEDDEDDYIITRELLDEVPGTKYTVDWVTSYKEALAAVEQKQHDVYLFDNQLGERTGLELLKACSALDIDTPVILMTGIGDRETDVLAMKAGAADYLVKGEVTTSLIERSIRYAIERNQADKEIARLAFYDSLTGLPNRVLFKDRLDQALARSERDGVSSALLFFDIDNFKRINDTLGHPAGDLLLKSIADRLSAHIRNCDTLSRAHSTEENENLVARLGGDEFVLLLGRISRPEDASLVAKRVLSLLADPFMLEGNEIYVSVSIGIAVYPADGRSVDELIKTADMAMYQVKERGKNGFRFYEPAMHAAAVRRLEIEADLRRAIADQEFVLHYQPKLEAQTKKLVAVEALLRWHIPGRGMLPPGEFIPVAEETGLINVIGDWVLRTACQQVKQWADAGAGLIPVSVNLSSQQFEQPNLKEKVCNALAAAQISPKSLLLEITESTLMRNSESSAKTLANLHEMGLRFSIDDFGTGYSSLGYLKRFPLYALKIDRSFVKDIPSDADDIAIVKAIIAMASSLKLKVVAEGVETDEQSRFLCQQGCDWLQGYLFSPPVPQNEIPDIVNRHGLACELLRQEAAKSFTALSPEVMAL
jgi:diguanylate cyclase (GGDEF)-like protein